MNSTAYVEKISSLFGRIIANSLQLQIPDELVDVDLTYQQLHALIYINQHTSCSIGDLASGLAITHPAAVKLIERMQRKGLVTKNEDLQDRRVSCITLTIIGRTVVESVQARRSETISRALENMTLKEQQGLISGLEKLLAASLGSESLIESTCLRCGVSHMSNCVVNRAHVALTGSGIEKT
ncbi:MAG: MarR family transcriptional regulator [Armatimonadota bacterium]|nr:MarR family transcriptional regulator [Armatimonadota bacterium]